MEHSEIKYYETDHWFEIEELQELLQNLVIDYKDELKISGRGAYMSYSPALTAAEKYLTSATCNSPKL